MNLSLRWATNMADLGRCAIRAAGDECVIVPPQCGLASMALVICRIRRCDVVLIHQHHPALTPLLALRHLGYARRARVVVADHIFDPSPGVLGGLRARAKGLLFRKVDCFLLPQRDVAGICARFALPRRSFAYCAFKPNSQAAAPRSEGYVFAGGQSRRDHGTFCSAMRKVQADGVLLTPDESTSRRHGSTLRGVSVPSNVRLVRHDGDAESWRRWLGGAAIVVISIRKDVVSAAGISVLLEALAMGKPVVITEGCATRGVIEDGKHALVVPPGDTPALAGAISRLLQDDALRGSLSTAGRDFALALGNETSYVARMVRQARALALAGR